MRVKRGSPRLARLAKRFDGWQPGLAAVLLSWGAVVLIVPRPVPPTEVPEPLVSAQELLDLRAVEAQRAAAARRTLPPSLRALGAAIRDVGRAEARNDLKASAAARGVVGARMSALPRDSLPDLLALRAFQAEAFTASLRVWERSGETSEDLVELGGNLIEVFRGAGWCVQRDGARLVILSDDELGVAFRKRWNELAGIQGGAALPTLAEERLLFGFALRHPRAEAAVRGDARGAAAVSAQSLLRRIDEHGRLDPDYPVDFARGVVLYASGQYARAAKAFEAHLAARPDGPLAARAHDHARAALVAELGEDPNRSWFSL